jgi:hypothetical protein
MLGGCATQQDVRAMRRPNLPPKSVVLAQKSEPLYRSVAIYEILGAPEFKLFDGDDLWTTRPTRKEVAQQFWQWLYDADMLAVDVRHSKYLLTVEFQDLRGPDVIPFTDKRAHANVRFLLQDTHTKEIVFDHTYEGLMQARMPGVTEEMVRAAIVGGVLGGAIGASLFDDQDADVGKLNVAQEVTGIGGDAGAKAGLFASSHQTLLWDWPEAPMLNWHDMLNWQDNPISKSIADGAGRGLFFGAVGAVSGAAGSGNLTQGQAGFSGGAVGATAAFFGAAPLGRPPESSEAHEQLGSFSGKRRREEAVNGMLLQSFSRFLGGAAEARMITIRKAVTCDDLNLDGPRRRGKYESYGIATLTSTWDSVAYDCNWPRSW